MLIEHALHGYLARRRPLPHKHASKVRVLCQPVGLGARRALACSEADVAHNHQLRGAECRVDSAAHQSNRAAAGAAAALATRRLRRGATLATWAVRRGAECAANAGAAGALCQLQHAGGGEGGAAGRVRLERASLPHRGRDGRRLPDPRELGRRASASGRRLQAGGRGGGQRKQPSRPVGARDARGVPAGRRGGPGAGGVQARPRLCGRASDGVGEPAAALQDGQAPDRAVRKHPGVCRRRRRRRERVSLRRLRV
mmetsp:Transcript_1713/g.5544  ORF Transcript_1713/g.5544 Transcript_1713/m.5544 type:complete len:255 (+) Transcript_1713:119-883(+)